MKKPLLFPLLIVALLVGAGLWIGLGTGPSAPATPDGPPAITPVAPPPAVPTFQAPPADAAAATDAPDETPGGPITAGDILAEPDEDLPRVARKLIALARDGNAPMEDRDEALTHALNLSAGVEAELFPPLVSDPSFPDELAEVVLTDALNNSLSYQADLYLAALATRKSAEMQTLIREHLMFLTDATEDLGSDPDRWRAPIEAAKKTWDE